MQFSEDRGLLAKVFSDIPQDKWAIPAAALTQDDFYQNMVTESRWFQEMILSIDAGKQRVDVPRLDRNTTHLKGTQVSGPTLLAKLTLPTVTSVAKKSLQAQIYLDEAAIACAIERFRLAHHVLPAKLNDLHMANLPHDIINGEPLHYSVTEPDNYILYSVGWNGTDDGEKIVKRSDGAPDFEQGDWVWSLKPM